MHFFVKWAILAVFFLGRVKLQPLVNVSVYYESHCPDSANFINNQLVPAYEKLGKYLNVELKPFGNAQFTKRENGGYSFTCQHGPSECYGNLIHACLLDKLTDNSAEVAAIGCLMEDYTDNEQALKKCLTRNDENYGPDYSEILDCATSERGEIILKNFGDETDNLDPEHYFIPWITINGVWKKEEFEASLKDFETMLCKNYLQNVPECL